MSRFNYLGCRLIAIGWRNWTVFVVCLLMATGCDQCTTTVGSDTTLPKITMMIYGDGLAESVHSGGAPISVTLKKDKQYTLLVVGVDYDSGIQQVGADGEATIHCMQRDGNLAQISHALYHAREPQSSTPAPSGTDVSVFRATTVEIMGAKGWGNFCQAGYVFQGAGGVFYGFAKNNVGLTATSPSITINVE